MMTCLKKYFCFIASFFILLGFSVHVLAADTFIVKKIEVKGAQHLAPATILNYVPLHSGQAFTESKGVQITEALYQTKFFNDIELSRAGNTLIITVQERPTISLIRFAGNSAITDKQLKSVLKDLDIQEGSFYNPAQLKSIQEGLKQQYEQMGYGKVQVNTKVQNESNNQVSINIQVIEGPISKVKHITIIGNHAFSQRALVSNFSMTPTNLFSFFTKNDRFSQDRLDSDCQTLGNFYLDHGYLQFKILSKNVTASADHSGIDITITIDEGPVFHISGTRLATNPLNKKADFEKLITLKAGDAFSRQTVLNINQSMEDLLSDYGYAFSKVETTPSLNAKNHTVFLTWTVIPGRRVYVRYIHFQGNTKTQDYVLRSQLRQLEGSLYSSSKINESKRLLANLPYLRDIKATPVPVPGKSNQVDLNMKVTEVNAGQASLQGGYSDTEGFLYGASISEPDFLGSGKYVAIGFQRSQYQQNYYFNYNNPFYTINGVSRGFGLYYQRTTPGNVNITSYAVNGFGGYLNYGIPISDFNNFGLRFGYDYMDVSTTADTDPSILNFINEHGSIYNQFTFTPSWTYNSYNRAIFPTEGLQQQASVETGLPALKTTLPYYKLNYAVSYFKPIFKQDWVLNLHSTLGYGNGYAKMNGELPFFDNYFAGGIDTLPGFESNTLGPKDQYGNGLGGNILTLAGMDFIFPNYISDTLRTALTFNAGNVYQNRVELGDLRYSAGLKVSWFTPIGPVIEFSLAEPLHTKAGDEKEIFQFSFGASI